MLQQHIYSQEFVLDKVRLSVVNFVFGCGIRQYLCEIANRLNITGFTRRINHSHVRVRVEGTIAQLSQFKAILMEQCERRMFDSLIANSAVHLVTGRNYNNFAILRNEHNNCDRNPPSNGEEWEKKSSSVGSV